MLTRKLLLSIFFTILIGVSTVNLHAQTSRKAVGGAEVTGTFRSYYTGKFKGNYDEIQILALGRGKIRIAFELTYPYFDGAGEMSANMGSADGEAEISGDTAVYSSKEGKCTITIKFVKPGQIKVTQSGADFDCGFGHNVTADGTYKKFSGAKPKFEQNN